MASLKPHNVRISPKQRAAKAPRLIGSSWVGAYVVLIVALVVAFIWGYLDTQQGIVREHQLQDQHEAQLTAILISSTFSGFFDHLNLMAKDPNVINMTLAGRAKMNQLFENDQPTVTAVTRISSRMEITYTTPDKTAIGADLSHQLHNQIMVEQQRRLVSSPFMAVQGYKAVSVAIPLTKNGKFVGSLAVLVDFQKVAEKALKTFFSGDDTYIYLINSYGVIIHSPHDGQTGQNAQAVFGMRPGMEGLLAKMASGQTGYGAAQGGFYPDLEDREHEVLVAYAPARLTDQDSWTVCIVADKKKVLSSAAATRLPYLIAALFALFVLLVASNLIRVTTKYKNFLERAVQSRTQALQASEEKHRVLIESMAEGIVVTDANRFIVFANPAMERILGQKPNSLLGTKLSDYLAQGQMPDFLKQQGLLQLGKEPAFELKTVSPGGDLRDLLLAAKPRWDDQQKFFGATWFIQDITERKHAEDLLTMERQVFLGGPVVVFKWVAEENWPVQYVSPNVTQFGYSVEQWISGEISINSIIHRDDVARVAQEVQTFGESGVKTFEQEYRIIQGDGRVRWVYDFTSIIRNDEGKITHYLGYIFDETEVKRAGLVQEVLVEISEAHSQTEDLGSLVEIIRNLLGKLIDTTNFYVALFDSATGLYSFPFFADEKDQNFKPQPLKFSLTDYVRRTGEPQFVNDEIHERLVADGEIQTIGVGPMSTAWLGAPLKSATGIFGVVAVQHYTNPKNYEPSDLELLAYVSDHIALAIERKRAETALSKSEESYRQLVESAQESIITVDEDELITFSNQAFSEAMGYSNDELLGLPLTDFADPKSVANIIQETQNRKLGQADSYEIRFIAKTGEFKDFISTSSPFTDDEGNYQGSMAVMMDITERKKTEGMLLHSQKLESLGVLAGGIAHDFNNLLVGILGNSGLALQETDKSSRIYTYLADIENAANRATDLTRQLLAYAGKGKIIYGPTNLCELVLEMGRLIGSAIPDNVELKYNLDDSSSTVQADAVQIRQVIMNLIINAAESFNEANGIVEIKVGQQFADENYLNSQFVRDNFKAGEYAFIEVSDNGAGMSQDTLAKVFDPFFSTKLAGRGLGLAAVLGIIRGHGGSIKVYSELGKGSSFKILLPLDSSLKEEPVLLETDEAIVESGTVLLIDDEPTIRSVGSRILNKFGFKVVCAADGVEGLGLFKTDPDWYDLVVLDLTMPRMGGGEVLEELRLIKKDVKVLITSGYSEHETQNKFAGMKLVGFLQKPFSPEVFLAKVRKIMTFTEE